MAFEPENSPVIQVSEINEAYRRSFGVDVSRFFIDETVKIEAIIPYGYCVFSGALAGDSQFYSDLMSKIGYDDGEKAEFKAAKEYAANGESVLDVGCGPGRFNAYCTGPYKGIELNPSAVAEARRHGRNVVVEMLEDQQDGAYDVVTLFQVLEHVTNPQQFLADAARKVAVGGRLIVSTPNMSGYMAESINHVLNYPPHHLTWWTGKSIAALMAANGIEDMVEWEEPLAPIHVSTWLEATLFPRGKRHFDFSRKARLARLISKVGGIIARPFVGSVSGQCVMVVGRRPT